VLDKVLVDAARAAGAEVRENFTVAGVLGGSVPLREFMSPRTIVRLVGVRGFLALMRGQARYLGSERNTCTSTRTARIAAITSRQ